MKDNFLLLLLLFLLLLNDTTSEKNVSGTAIVSRTAAWADSKLADLALQQQVAAADSTTFRLACALRACLLSTYALRVSLYVCWAKLSSL